jgi:lysophospholipase L1-like esterase
MAFPSRRAALACAAVALVAERTNGHQSMTHIALLGDSVIDNKAYVGNGPDVADQVRMAVPKDWRVTRLAIDGAVTSGVLRQLSQVPVDTTHLVICAGGNDALREAHILDAPARSVAEVLMHLAQIQDRFREGYLRMLEAALRHNLPVALCTIYDPRFPERDRRRLGALALSVINDAITREVFSRGADLIDLRVLFDDDADFANAIEPSVRGGMKLARAIHAFAADSRGQTRVFR